MTEAQPSCWLHPCVAPLRCMQDEIILCVPLPTRRFEIVFFSQIFLQNQILLRASAVQLVSPCFLRVSVPPWWVLLFGCGSATLCLRGGFWSLVVARLRCGEKVFLRYTHSMARGW